MSDRICRGIRGLLIGVFFVLLWMPLADSFFNLDPTVPPNENRRFARVPRFEGVAHCKQFIAGLEEYFNDHFGFRKRLVTWNNEWKHQLFHEAPFSSVITGRDGWLFLASYQMIENYSGFSRLTQQELEDWQHLLEARRDWLARFGAKYLFVIAPDKHSIYPEYLPEWLQPGPQPPKLDQFVEHMKKHSTVDVLDLRPALRAAKQTELVYSLTDTHWNSLGAFVTYQKLVQAISRQIPCSHPLTIEAFERKPVLEQCDLARLAGQSQPEKQFQLLPRPPLEPLAQTNGKARPEETWPEPDPIITENKNATGRAMMYRDSFADGWIPYLGYHFNQIVYVIRQDWDFEFMERHKPDIVIDELVERYFNTLKPGPILAAHREHVRLMK